MQAKYTRETSNTSPGSIMTRCFNPQPGSRTRHLSGT